MPAADARAHMSVVAQDTVLFNDTIESNIAMGKPGATTLMWARRLSCV